MEEKTGHRILVITERFYPESFLINDLVQEWTREGHSIRVLTQVPSYPRDRLFSGYSNTFSARWQMGAFVKRFKTVLGYRKSKIRKVLNYLSFMVKACWYSLREIPGSKVLFIYHTGPLTQALPAVIAKRIFKRRTIIWTQDVWPDAVFAYGFAKRGPFAVLLKWFVRSIYHHIDRVLVSSPGFQDRLLPYVRSTTKIDFVPQWVPAVFEEGHSHRLSLECGGTRFVFTGNLGTMQNLEMLIRAFGEIPGESATLFLVGDGSERPRLQRIVETEGIKNVRFLGIIPQSQVKSCIQSCDFSVLSLDPDSYISLTIPAKFFSYIAAGRPILCAASGEVRSIMERNSIGVLADPEDIDSIKKAIAAAVQATKEQYETWSQSIKFLSQNFYSRQSLINKLSKIIMED